MPPAITCGALMACGRPGPARHIDGMMTLDLSDEEKRALGGLLKRTIADDPYPLSPRIRTLRGILAKLEPTTTAAEPLPPTLRCTRTHTPHGGGRLLAHGPGLGGGRREAGRMIRAFDWFSVCLADRPVFVWAAGTGTVTAGTGAAASSAVKSLAFVSAILADIGTDSLVK